MIKVKLSIKLKKILLCSRKTYQEMFVIMARFSSLKAKRVKVLKECIFYFYNLIDGVFESTAWPDDRLLFEVPYQKQNVNLTIMTSAVSCLPENPKNAQGHTYCIQRSHGLYPPL